jgi:hypothetical protein
VEGDLDLEEVLGISNTFNATVLNLILCTIETTYISFSTFFCKCIQSSRYSDGFAF